MRSLKNWLVTEDKLNHGFAMHVAHKCKIPKEIDDVTVFYSPNTWKNRLYKNLFLFRTVSIVGKSYTHHLRSFGSLLQEKERHLKYHRYIVHPYSYLRVLWEIIICCVILIDLVLVPIHVGLCELCLNHLIEHEHTLIDSIILIMDLFLFTDVILNMFTGYYSEPDKEIILETVLVIKHYLKTFFLLDFTSSIPFIIPYVHPTDNNLVIINTLIVVKTLRFITFMIYYKRLIHFTHFRFTISSVILLFIAVILYWHSLTWYLLFVKQLDVYFGTVVIQLDYAGSLEEIIPQVGYKNTEFNPFINCFYEASMIIYTSWYTHSNPNGLIEYGFVTCMWFISKAFQFLILAKTLQIMKGVNSSHQKYVEMERQLKEYMRDKQLPTFMRSRLLAYYDFRFQRNYFRESEILGTVSEQLKQEITMNSCKQLVENVAFFKNLPVALLLRIVSCLKEEIYLMNDVIIRANTPGNCMYFISSGTVAIYSMSGKEICHLEDGHHFGEIVLVKKALTRIASVVAIEICEVYRFDSHDFNRAIYPYPDLIESIEKIAVERMEKTFILDDYYGKHEGVPKSEQRKYQFGI